MGSRRPRVRSPHPATGKIDASNARAVEDNRRLDVAAVRDRSARVHRDPVESISRMTDEEWTAPASYQTSNRQRRRLCTLLGSILAAPQRPFGHAFAHVPDLEAYVRSATQAS